ncbi:MAG: ethanolamine utilization protein EutA [Actinobacteria bacterium 69-20]|jgi:excisionase family DNA binding protein|nr:helix-turn-helix domain-containing protein [Actinomycetota bacterium]OJV26594.1 MAG: ethanolamine utilization protein EutA [Actinobacteria bacterium 69-20]
MPDDKPRDSITPDRPAARARHTAGAAPNDPALAEMRFFTVAEVAEVMRVSRMTVYRLVHSGELPAVRVGRSFRVPQRAVHEYLRAAFTDAG